MKLSDVCEAERVALAREELLGRIEDAKGKFLDIQIRGRHQDAELVEAARTSVVLELIARLKRVNGELLKLGVEIER